MGTYVDDWNSHYINVFIPNIVWNILCLLLGLIGNSCVLFIYIFKMKQHREDRYFIPILAWLDLMASMLATIYYITDYFYFIAYSYRFSNFLHVCFIGTLSTSHWHSKIFENMQTTWFSNDLVLEKGSNLDFDLCSHKLLCTNTFRSWQQKCGLDIQRKKHYWNNLLYECSR